MMTNTWLKLLGFMIALLLLSMGVAQAVSYPAPPSIAKRVFVVDKTASLTKRSQQVVNTLAADLWKAKRIPLAVLIVQSLHQQHAKGFSLVRYGQGLSRYWQFGGKQYYYNVILLISKADHEATIILGRGWRHRYDVERYEILKTILIPLLKHGDINRAVRLTSLALSNMVQNKPLPSLALPLWYWGLVIIFCVLGIGIIYSLLLHGRYGWGWRSLTCVGLLIAMILRLGMLIRRQQRRDEQFEIKGITWGW